MSTKVTRTVTTKVIAWRVTEKILFESDDDQWFLDVGNIRVLPDGTAPFPKPENWERVPHLDEPEGA